MRAYKKDQNDSYVSGVYATLELLLHKPDIVTRVYLHSRGEKNAGVAKIKELSRSIPQEIADSLIENFSKSENTYAMAEFSKYESPLEKEANHLVLVNPSDMGNLGTIIRTMVGLGMKNLVIIRPGVDIFDPKVIRASLGALFQINFTYVESYEEYLKEFPRTIYPFMLTGKKSLEDISFTSPYSLVFGNEGAGLEDSFQTESSVRIPQSENIDSLNLSISVGIALYKAYLQK